MRLLISTVATLALLAGLAHAHGGGLDARGGHTDSRTGKYHCHRAGCEGGGSPLESASGVIISVSSDRPRVVDGDTLQVGVERVRLHGIDAPESAQLCRRGGHLWECGKEATKALRSMIDGQPVTCEGRERDRYKRLVGVCRAGGVELNAALIEAGLALAHRRYSEDYVPQEEGAKVARKGMWAGEFIPPWKWRRGERLDGETSD